MKNSINIIIVFSLIFAFGYWRAASDSGSPHAGCTDNYASYKELIIKSLNSASNVNTSNQIAFNDDLEVLKGHISRCSDQQVLELMSIGEFYQQAMLSVTEDYLIALKVAERDSKPPRFDLSERSISITKKLQELNVPNEQIGTLTETKDEFSRVFDEYHEYSERDKALLLARFDTVMAGYNQKTELTMSRLFGNLKR